jgi:hypothetical protein
MTTLVTSIKPFRAWQYRKDSGEAVPEWVDLDLVPKVPRICDIRDQCWLVEETWGRLTWCTPAEFAERFKIVEGT